MIYVFFNLNEEPLFKLKSSYENALVIANSACGNLYFLELKGEDLVVAEGPHKGQKLPEQPAKEVIEQLPFYSEGEALIIADKKLRLKCGADDDYYYRCGRHCILMKERERVSRCIHVRWKFEGDKVWHKL